MKHRSKTTAATASGSARQLTTRRDFSMGLALSALTCIESGLPAIASAQAACTLPPGNGTPFRPDAALAVRLRQQIDRLNFAELTKLKSAYAAMKLLSISDPADPRGFDQQANLHCIYCGGSDDVHFSYYFYPWHRAYLYFHERILGKLIGDPTFTLPYWAWDIPGFQQLPPAYQDPTLSLNPMFDSLRGVDATVTMSDTVIRMSAPLAPGTVERAMRTVPPEGFLGEALSGGNLEGSPHGTIHNWISSRDAGRGVPDMGVFRTAARDPVFFAHHGNIDRLWTEWIAQPGRRNYSDAAWLNTRWVFWDENRSLTSISIRDVLDHEKSLRYRYAVALPPNVVPAAPRSSTPVITVPVHSTPGGRSLGPAPFTATVAISLDQRGTLLTARPELGRSVLLEIGGIDVPGNSGALIRVFLNKPDANVATPVSDPAFIDSIAIVPHVANAAEPHLHKKKTVLLELTDQIQVALLNVLATTLSITLVPVGNNGQVPTDSAISFETITIRALQA